MMDPMTRADVPEQDDAPPPYRPPPEPVTWTFPKPIELGSASYTEATIRTPLAEEVLKATALPGSNLDVSLRLLGIISDVPYDVLKQLPAWMIDQMSRYVAIPSRGHRCRTLWRSGSGRLPLYSSSNPVPDAAGA